MIQKWKIIFVVLLSNPVWIWRLWKTHVDEDLEVTKVSMEVILTIQFSQTFPQYLMIWWLQPVDGAVALVAAAADALRAVPAEQEHVGRYVA